ncbi:AfsR/SARP family transcriptional regulator [Saccharothrix australiensis]|uniref:DNA-binding SARP family transcriptional activator n=1 Tax=Saccharothrix australiensis TaxID=2072 RepID=A0A495VZA5_9PSEU|nr:BTAD domain-containing putative transcriptional regulator [Saccharothrix australiensis]RKT54200.1 DNA-binding SARP family transcriptional activator [Saccharothrix australiensis]
MAVEFRVLGPVEAHVDGRWVELGPARQRWVLAVLLVEANRLLPADRLLDHVWGDRVPSRGRDVLYGYLSRLRRVLRATGEADIVRRTGGYELVVDEGVVDVHRFRRLLADARATDDARAVAMLEQALGLWRGEVCAGLDTSWVDALRAELDRQRFTAELDRAEFRVRTGRHAEALADLSALSAAHPLDERVAAQFMLALCRSGRQADALAHYQRMRVRLADDLGADPGPSLRELHQRILTSDPALTHAVPDAGTSRSPVVPRQLPAAPALFTGRRAELARLDHTLATAPDDPAAPGPAAAGTAVMISAIGGAGGIGKTWLALTWAHRNLHRFPDGQLFADLRGFSPTGEPTGPAVAVRGFLDALGVDPRRVPPDLDARVALYRSLVAGRRMLVVLDNAATSEQVVPLLPGSPTCTVLVTGRHRLASLIDRHGTRHLALDVLDRDEGRALLAARIGADRVAGEPDAVDELVELCGGYPLALSITARNAATRAAIALREVAAELRELGLEVLDHDTDHTASLPAVLSWSLRRLTDEQRTVFALLGIAPGPDTTPAAAIALTGLSSARTRKALSALEEASLLDRRPGGRYAMHDLVRDYAGTTARATLPEDVREAALVRVMGFHLHTAHTADHLLDPHHSFLRPDPPASDVHPLPLPDAAAATAWLAAEHATLLATQHAAAALGRHHVVWHLAWTLHTFHLRRGHLRDALVVWRTALDAADHLPDPAARSCAHRNLGQAYSLLGLHEEAARHLDRALDLAVRHHDTAEQAHTHHKLALARERRGDDRGALEHARHALALHRTLGQPVMEAAALNLVGWFAARLGDYDTARDHCEAALALAGRHHDAEGKADTLDSLGLIAHRTGDHRRAVDRYRQALGLYRTLGHTYEIANTLDNAGHPHAALGERDQARAVWREALELYREQGRDTDVERVRRQLDDLDPTPEPDGQPSAADSAGERARQRAATGTPGSARRPGPASRSEDAS